MFPTTMNAVFLIIAILCCHQIGTLLARDHLSESCVVESTGIAGTCEASHHCVHESRGFSKTCEPKTAHAPPTVCCPY